MSALGGSLSKKPRSMAHEDDDLETDAPQNVAENHDELEQTKAEMEAVKAELAKLREEKAAGVKKPAVGAASAAEFTFELTCVLLPAWRAWLLTFVRRGRDKRRVVVKNFGAPRTRRAHGTHAHTFRQIGHCGHSRMVRQGRCHGAREARHFAQQGPV